MTFRSDVCRSDGAFAPGLPPDGAAGTYLALDASGRLWLLVWHPRGEWNGLAYETPDWPVLKRGADLAARIVDHMPVPVLERQRPG